MAAGAKFYRSLAEFERAEIHPDKKCGWSLDDLYNDAAFPGTREETDEDGRELDFDMG